MGRRPRSEPDHELTPERLHSRQWGLKLPGNVAMNSPRRCPPQNAKDAPTASEIFNRE